MKPPWSLVRLRVSSWDGDIPVAGDELVTRTGRRYQNLEVKPKASICFVLPHDAPSKITCSGGTGIDAMRHDRHA